jgi:DNA-directed RNA polymerase
LAESERPGDVYTAILKLVINDMQNDNNPDGMKIAEALEGKVTRKVIK